MPPIPASTGFKEFELEMSELKELGGSGNFLQPTDVETDMVVTIVEAPRIVPSTFKDAQGKTLERCRVTVRVPKKGDRAWTMNNTTYRALRNAFGNKPDKWVKQKVRLTVVKQMVRNELRNVIYGEPVEPKPKAK